MTNKLTALRVEKEKEPGRYGDGGGLYLQVQARAKGGVSKQWLFRYQLNGRERFMGLGSYPTFNLKEARERARTARQMVQDGIDPIEAKLVKRDVETKEARERISFREAVKKFLSVHASKWKSAKHRRQWEQSVDRYAIPKLGERAVTAIDQAMINDAVAPLWARAPETGRRTRDRIERVIQWIKDGEPMPTQSAPKVGLAALPWQEVPTFMAELRERQGVAPRALEFCILTATRTGEVRGATWDEINLDERTWTIPASRMKAEREHRVPLSDRAVEILRALPCEDGNDHLFIGAEAGRGIGERALLTTLQRCRKDVTTHGFRSSFSSWAREATHTPRDVVEMALAHAIKDKTEAAYFRGDLYAKRTKLMADWATYCTSRPAEICELPTAKARA